MTTDGLLPACSFDKQELVTIYGLADLLLGFLFSFLFLGPFMKSTGGCCSVVNIISIPTITAHPSSNKQQDYAAREERGTPNMMRRTLMTSFLGTLLNQVAQTGLLVSLAVVEYGLKLRHIPRITSLLSVIGVAIMFRDIRYPIRERSVAQSSSRIGLMKRRHNKHKEAYLGGEDAQRALGGEQTVHSPNKTKNRGGRSIIRLYSSAAPPEEGQCAPTNKVFPM